MYRTVLLFVLFTYVIPIYVNIHEKYLATFQSTMSYVYTSLRCGFLLHAGQDLNRVRP